MSDSASRYQQLRRQVTDQLIEISAVAPQAIRETLLIRDGFFCGYRFELGDWTAVWFFEEGQVKFYNGAGRLVNVLRLEPRQSQAA